jgi:hypothetical protein
MVLKDPLQVGERGIFLPDAMLVGKLLGQPRPLRVELEGLASERAKSASE